METFTFDDASKMTSEALFEPGWNFRGMPHGDRREDAGRARGSGNGPTIETYSVSLPPKTWQLIDEMRESSARRGIHLRVRLPANFGSLNHNRLLASEPSAKLATEYAFTIAKYVVCGDQLARRSLSRISATRGLFVTGVHGVRR
jgi:hypothetical protein